MVSQLYLDHEVCLGPENLVSKEGDSAVPPSSEDHATPPKPVKKATRKWAAWTHLEEESFFDALRLVGKNFEKITCHVQTKNKDQVRNYYYRLVRRMNKMLDPELCLDAKDSKDTVAAMLRWWSLLVKYRCNASKFHLKPRRFKIFIEALENLLWKDRKKNITKRPANGERKSSMVHNPASNQVDHDNNAEKVDIVGRKKVGNGKRSFLKRQINMGTNCNKSEAEPTTTKAAKRKRKTGIKSTAELKIFERAAVAGVLLVADAAEYLERTDKEIEHVQETPGQNVARGAHSLPITPQSTFNDQSIHNSGKLKLQLFPIDEFTRKTLEMDNHNPHLELTLSMRKKISSILEHLNRKWGNPSLSSQELMLFPYWAQREHLWGYQKWNRDSPLCAADIYNLIGSPPLFRLRYGWFEKAEVESATAQAIIPNNLNVKNLNFNIAEERNVETEYLSGPPINAIECGGSVSNASVAQHHENPAVVSSLGTPYGAVAVATQFETKDTVSSDWELPDSIADINVEDLLSEPTHEMDINYTQFPVLVGANSLEQMPFSCDSFDAAIADFLYKHQNKIDLEQSVASHGPSPSIWDADEACDAFSFQSDSAVCDKVEELLEEDKMQNNTPAFGEMMDRPDHTSKNSSKVSGGLIDIYWPDSLGIGPLDLRTPLCRNNSADLILSDSHGGFNSLVVNGQDAFQSCSLLGLEKKEPASITAEVLQNASFSDFTISSED